MQKETVLYIPGGIQKSEFRKENARDFDQATAGAEAVPVSTQARCRRVERSGCSRSENRFSNHERYTHDKVALEGFVAYSGKRPLVIVCHAWRGRDEFVCKKAEEIASWGYTCFAIDMYGKGVIGKSKEENAALKKPFMEDRKLLLNRLMKGYEAALAHPYAENQVAVLGMGFGGVCALDLARSGADIKGAVSIYGHFDPPPALPKKAIKAKILILHGHNDPISPMSDLLAFGQEMEQAKADWQAHIYGGTSHAFVNPSANDPNSGIQYHPQSAERAWNEVKAFFQQTLSR